MNKNFRIIALLIVLFTLAGCSGGGSSDENSKQTNWLTEPPYFGSESISKDDISKPATIINITENGVEKSDETLEAELQQAINKGEVITFDTSNKYRTIKLSKQLYIPVQGKSSNEWNNDMPVVIDGGGFITLDGNNITRIIEKAWKVNLTVQGVNFINGNSAKSETDRKSGGAINVENWDGSLKVINCNFTNCNAIAIGPDVGGGAVRCPGQKYSIFYNCNFTNCTGSNGGAVNSLGSELWLLKCSFTNCKATGTGGGAEVGASGQGGIGGAVYIDGISNNSKEAVLRVEQCEFNMNSSNEYGGAMFLYTYADSGSKSLIKECSFNENKIYGTTGFGGAIYSQNGEMNIVNTTFYKNESASMGGALWHLSDTRCRIANTTFSENISGNFGSAMQLNGPVYITSCTIADNECKGSYGGALRSGTANQTWLKNCVIANNSCSNGNIANAASTYMDGGGNYQWPNVESHVKAAEGVIFANPNLGAIKNNGGKTLTRVPQSDSKVVNGGTDEECMKADQIGNARIGKCDAGAVEVK